MSASHSSAFPFGAAGLRRVRQLLLVTGLAAASLAQAQVVMGEAQEHRVDNRQDRQAARIGQGVASGELTRHEAARLMHQQRHIHRLERRTEADGVVTGREAHRVEAAQDRASARIYRQKHDRQARPHAH
jgi:hypothetical protein